MPWAGRVPNDAVSLVLDRVLQLSPALFIFSFWCSFHLSLISCSQHPAWSCYNLVQGQILFSLRPPSAAQKAIRNAVLLLEVPSSPSFHWQWNTFWVTLWLMARNYFDVWGFLFPCLFWGWFPPAPPFFFFKKKHLPKPMANVIKGWCFFFILVSWSQKLSTVRWSIPYRSIEWVLHIWLFAWCFWWVIFYRDLGWHSQDKCQNLILISFDNIASKIHRSSETNFLTLYFLDIWECTRIHSNLSKVVFISNMNLKLFVHWVIFILFFQTKGRHNICPKV